MGSSAAATCLYEGQGRQRNPNPNFWVRISSGRVGVCTWKGWGPKSSVCTSKPRETKLFGGIPRGVCRDIPARCLKSLRRKSLGSILVPYFWRARRRYSSDRLRCPEEQCATDLLLTYFAIGHPISPPGLGGVASEWGWSSDIGGFMVHLGWFILDVGCLVAEIHSATWKLLCEKLTDFEYHQELPDEKTLRSLCIENHLTPYRGKKTRAKKDKIIASLGKIRGKKRKVSSLSVLVLVT